MFIYQTLKVYLGSPSYSETEPIRIEAKVISEDGKLSYLARHGNLGVSADTITELIDEIDDFIVKHHDKNRPGLDPEDKAILTKILSQFEFVLDEHWFK